MQDIDLKKVADLKKHEQELDKQREDREMMEVHERLRQAGNPNKMKEKIKVLQELAMKGNRAAINEISPSGGRTSYAKMLDAFKQRKFVPGRIG